MDKKCTLQYVTVWHNSFVFIIIIIVNQFYMNVRKKIYTCTLFLMGIFSYIPYMYHTCKIIMNHYKSSILMSQFYYIQIKKLKKQNYLS